MESSRRTNDPGRPLHGLTALVTRSREQASDLVGALESLGAEVLGFPTIAQVDPESWDEADAAIARLSVYDWVVFTSANAVDRFAGRLDALGVGSIGGAEVVAVGPGTAARAASAGIGVDVVASESVAEGVIAALVERGVGEGSRVLLPRALQARETLPETLRELGAVVDVVCVYRTVLGAGDPVALERLRAGDVDVVTFTSASTARNFVTLVGGDVLDLLEGATVASIGPITSRALGDLGLRVDVEAGEYTIDGLTKALAAHFAG